MTISAHKVGDNFTNSHSYSPTNLASSLSSPFSSSSSLLPLSLILPFKVFLHSHSYSSQHSFLIHSKEFSDLAEGISWKVAESEFESSSSDKYSHSITGKEVTGFLLADPLLIQECIFESIIISTTCQAYLFHLVALYPSWIKCPLRTTFNLCLLNVRISNYSIITFTLNRYLLIMSWEAKSVKVL